MKKWILAIVTTLIIIVVAIVHKFKLILRWKGRRFQKLMRKAPLLIVLLTTIGCSCGETSSNTSIPKPEAPDFQYYRIPETSVSYDIPGDAYNVHMHTLVYDGHKFIVVKEYGEPYYSVIHHPDCCLGR